MQQKAEYRHTNYSSCKIFGGGWFPSERFQSPRHQVPGRTPIQKHGRVNDESNKTKLYNKPDTNPLQHFRGFSATDVLGKFE